MSTYEQGQTAMATFATNGPAIADALSELDTASWVMVTPDGEYSPPSYLRFVSDAGDTIGAYLSRHDGKASIGGHYPKMPDGKDWYPRERVTRSEYTDIGIGVSLTKDPRQTAKDIVRRFLTPYRAYLAECKRQSSEQSSYHSLTATSFASVMAAADGVFLARQTDARYHYSQPDPTRITADLVTAFRPAYGDIIVQGDSVTLELRSIPVALAQTLCQAMREYIALHQTTSGED